MGNQTSCFGTKQAPKDASTLAKEQKRIIDKAIRHIEKDRVKLEKDEV